MHNIKAIRKNPENFENLLRGRNSNVSIKELLLLDKTNRDFIQKKELLEQEKKKNFKIQRSIAF